MNKIINKILIPVDFSETSDWAIKQGIKLAKTTNSKLVLIHIISTNQINYPVKFHRHINYELIVKQFVKDKLKILQETIYNEEGIKTNIFVKTGDVCKSIVGYSKLRNVDLILMGTRGASGLKEIFIGSNAMKVIMLSKTPVLTINKGKTLSAIKNILLPVSLSLLNKFKVLIGVELAKSLAIPIYLLGLKKSDKEHTKIKKKLNIVKDIISNEGVICKQNIISGSSLSLQALRYAKMIQSGLIIINTGKDANYTEHLWGLITFKLVNHSNIPILSIKRK